MKINRIERNPKKHLPITYMALYLLMHESEVDNFTLENAIKEIDEFTYFLKGNDSHTATSEIIVLLKPVRRIIEMQLNGNPIKELFENALCDFNKTIILLDEVIVPKV